MPETSPAPTKNILATLDEQVCLSLIVHERITSRALEAQTRLEQRLQQQQTLVRSRQIRSHIALADELSPTLNESYKDAFRESNNMTELQEMQEMQEILECQRVATSALRELLYELENLVLRLTVTTRLINSQSALDVDSLHKVDLKELDFGFSELRETYADIAGDKKELTGDNKHLYDNARLTLLNDRAKLAAEICALLLASFERIDGNLQHYYKGSLLHKALSLQPADLRTWLTRSSEVVADLEGCTTKQREDMMLWQKRTEEAWGRNNDGLANKAWQRKEQFASALSKLEAALVAQVEAAAVAKQRLNDFI